MRKAMHTRPLTISLCDEDFKRVKQITDDEMISMAEWFRAAAKLKLKQDEKEDSNNEK